MFRIGVGIAQLQDAVHEAARPSGIIASKMWPTAIIIQEANRSQPRPFKEILKKMSTNLYTGNKKDVL